jgi:hypothetical protein
MKRRKSEISPASLSQMLQELTTRTRTTTVPPEYCQCQPLAPSTRTRPTALDILTLDNDLDADPNRLLVSRDLSESLRTSLTEQIARGRAFSVLVLHIFQHEVIYNGPTTPAESSMERRRYHVTAEILDQVLANVRRVIRHDDAMLIHARTGAALILPDVDQQGIAHMLERVYESLDLLQGETLQPPLTREMTIQIGVSSYPMPASSLKVLLARAGHVARRLELQPALTRQLYCVKPIQPVELPQQSQKRSCIPFMELPAQIPTYLTALLPYQLARELRCIPVGRHQQTLTIALADPTSAEAIDRLHHTTGLSIFPVACQEQALNQLLTHPW